MVDKLTPVVCLNSFDIKQFAKKSFDRKLELALSVSKEADYMVAYIRLAFKWEQPAVVRKIIYKHQIVTTARDTKNRRCPNITMN
jgi:hypothetical protein